MFQAAHEKAIETHASTLTNALVAVRRSFEAAFWKNAKLHPATKSSTDDAISSIETNALIRAIEDLGDEGYASAVYDAQRILAEVGWSGAKTLVDLSAGFGVVPSWVLDRLDSESSQLALRVVGREQDALTAVVRQAFADGLSVPQTASAIADTFAQGYHIDGNVTLPTQAWSQMVARTELSRAANLGSMAAYQEAGVKKVEWLAQAGCDLCEPLNGETVDLGEVFPDAGVDSPPLHPNCRCVLSPVDVDLSSVGGTAEDRNTAIRGGYSADDFEQQFGFTHPIDDQQGD
jgi:SPP1 gp7 family putative phage head morphogenesis protein